jgi:hypothetical protein
MIEYSPTSFRVGRVITIVSLVGLVLASVRYLRARRAATE